MFELTLITVILCFVLFRHSQAFASLLQTYFGKLGHFVSLGCNTANFEVVAFEVQYSSKKDVGFSRALTNKLLGVERGGIKLPRLIIILALCLSSEERDQLKYPCSALI
jgi:hypothetical protein